VLRTKVDGQQAIWEALLPEEFRRLPPGLEAVDQLLDDPVFFEPFVPYFSPLFGRPSTPIEIYLRLMHLRFRYRLGFESLCGEVADSLAWRRFCRIGPYDAVPDPSTLMKITKRCGEEVIQKLNEALLKKAAGEHLVKLDKVRVDSTVVAANVAYPTDSGLLAKGVAKLATSVARLKKMGLAPRTRFRNRTRVVRRKAHDIGAWLRRRSDEARAEVLAITGELAEIAEATIAEARTVAHNASRALARIGEDAPGRALCLVADIERVAGLLETVVGQSRMRIGGGMPNGATRLVSLHDKDARAIKKGRLGKPVEFGYKAQIADNTDGLVLDLALCSGNPNDATLLVPAIKRLKALFGRTPRAVTADRGYSESGVEAELGELGASQVVIPYKGRKSAKREALESARPYRRLVKWRTGSEGRISYLKHAWGLERTLFDGTAGAATWCGWGVFGHNATKVVGLRARREAEQREATERRQRQLQTAGPPGT
jgi:transposase, IS5 family